MIDGKTVSRLGALAGAAMALSSCSFSGHDEATSQPELPPTSSKDLLDPNALVVGLIKDGNRAFELRAAISAQQLEYSGERLQKEADVLDDHWTVSVPGSKNFESAAGRRMVEQTLSPFDAFELLQSEGKRLDDVIGERAKTLTFNYRSLDDRSRTAIQITLTKWKEFDLLSKCENMEEMIRARRQIKV